MTFAQICKLHQADTPLQFTHPDFDGHLAFLEDGRLVFIARDGDQYDGPPLWLSDFNRDDWHTINP